MTRLTIPVDSAGTNNYSYHAGGLLYTEGGLWASDIVTNLYSDRLRTDLVLQQPTLTWTNKFAWDAAKRLNRLDALLTVSGATKADRFKWRFGLYAVVFLLLAVI